MLREQRRGRLTCAGFGFGADRPGIELARRGARHAPVGTLGDLGARARIGSQGVGQLTALGQMLNALLRHRQRRTASLRPYVIAADP